MCTGCQKRPLAYHTRVAGAKTRVLNMCRNKPRSTTSLLNGESTEPATQGSSWDLTHVNSRGKSTQLPRQMQPCMQLVTLQTPIGLLQQGKQHAVHRLHTTSGGSACSRLHASYRAGLHVSPVVLSRRRTPDTIVAPQPPAGSLTITSTQISLSACC